MICLSAQSNERRPEQLRERRVPVGSRAETVCTLGHWPFWSPSPLPRRTDAHVPFALMPVVTVGGPACGSVRSDGLWLGYAEARADAARSSHTSRGQPLSLRTLLHFYWVFSIYL